MYLLDFETRSGTDIARGHDNYFQDPDADILCLSYGDEDAPRPFEWWPGCGYEPTALFEYAAGGGMIGASNASFDENAWSYLCTEKYGFPPTRRDQWFCTQAQSRAAGLPSALDKAANALKIKMRKSRRGAELIRMMCIPPFEFTPELLAEMVAYCSQDWHVMRDAMKCTPLLTPALFSDYLVNEIINERGVKIDRELALAAHQYAAQERAEIAGKLIAVTCEAVTKPTQHKRFKEWLQDVLEDDGCQEAIKLMVRYKKGVKKYSSDKSVRTNMLVDPAALGLAGDVVKALQLMDDAGGSATSKFAKMALLACEDDRVRGAIRFAGAASTLRYSSMGLQLHNMISDSFEIDEALHYRTQILAGDTLTHPENKFPVRVMETLGMLLRAAIIPEEGKVFVVGDWSSVEARMTAWLARDKKKLALFERGESPYCYAAEGIYGYSITKEFNPKEYQVGKICELACGFLGGPGALASMASQKSVYIPEEMRQDIVNSWRAKHPKIVNYGDRLFTTALAAMRNINTWVKADRVAYLFDGSALYCRLPDGKTYLRYPDARVEMVPAPWNKDQLIVNITALKAAFTKAADADEWPRHSLWRGLLLENIVQASCAIMLREKVDIFQETCIFHVHDELILEVLKAQANAFVTALQTEMEKPSVWAPGLLLEAKPEIMLRYGKGK